MNAENHHLMTHFQETVARLPWVPKHAEQSARLALSKAQCLGLDKEQAIQQVFETALGGFFQQNPHLPYEAWQTISQEMGGEEDFALATS